jgi:pimeloyl-ACP methyl ester carboxylesterase
MTLSTPARRARTDPRSIDLGCRLPDLAVRLQLPDVIRVSPGLCVLYFHGFGSSQDGDKAAFFRQRMLELGCPFCSFDLRGHGCAGGDMESLTFSRCLDDAASAHQTLEQRGYQRLILFGSSLGGAVAMWHAARRPEAAAAGVYIATALNLLDMVETWAGPQGLEAWRESGFTEYENEHGRHRLGWQLVDDLRSFDHRKLLASYRTPSLILHGGRDDSVPYTSSVDFATSCPGAEIELHLFGSGDHRLADRLDTIWDLAALFLSRRKLL